jgi:acetyltransferase-like isoleucine patch superfamily enzyme
MRRGARIEGLGRVELFEQGTAELGRRVRVARGAELVVSKGALLSIGDDVSIGSFSNIRAERSITIGARVLIAQHVSIIGGQYSFDRRDIPLWEQPYKAGDVTLGEDCWIGVGATILPDVSIGVGAIVAAGAVVTEDVPDHAIFGGVPARQIGTRP